LDNRLIVNFAAFYAKYKNFQAQASVDDPDDLLPASLVLVNAGKVSTQGIELEVIAQPSVDWMITGGVAYTDATIDDYPEGNCSGGQKYRGECPLGFQNLSGGQLPYTPKWKLNLSTNYTIQLDDLPFNVVFGGNLRSQDAVLYGLSQDENTKQEAYTIVDIRATLAGTRDGYRVTAFVKNIFDTNYASLIYANSEVLLPNGYIQYVPKYANRTAGIEVRYDF
jgi:iron complex outermembrane receptor protein